MRKVVSQTPELTKLMGRVVLGHQCLIVPLQFRR